TNSIIIYPSPKAQFTYTPEHLSMYNNTVTFTNGSEGATSYRWSFGDDNYSADENPVHYYPVVDNYLITLIAYNEYNCTDTARSYTTSENTVVFPTAFTPNTTGPNGGAYDIYDLSNDIFYPLT